MSPLRTRIMREYLYTPRSGSTQKTDYAGHNLATASRIHVVHRDVVSKGNRILEWLT